MPEVRFTQEDLNERKSLSVGWRVLRVTEVRPEGPGKTDPDSITYPVFFIVDEGPDKGTRLRKYFNSKLKGQIIDFLRCFADGKDLDPTRGYRLEDTLDYTVQGFITNDPRTGYNNVQDFKPIKR